ncbi:MAG TPA: NAD(P)H-quinone oxidoreductase [Sneathiellales bacterium]|nr:NAD(P)H-quinone oxidoreductase [Sneathiellales bacterium]
MTVIPDNMIAIEITEPGGPDVLRPVKLSVPRPGPNEVLVKVAAAGVNRPDALQRAGGYPPPPGAPATPGLEVAGTIVEVGQDTREWQVGDQLCALLAGGGYAEYAVVPAPQALPLPNGYNMVQAAALPETFFTVWTNVFERGALKPGESILIHGGSSGIGTTAIQLASVLGSTVYATAGSAEKCKACENLGAAQAINYRKEDFGEVIEQVTEGAGVDVVLDMVGGDYFQKNIACAAMEGRIVNIAFLNGPVAEVNFMPLLLKRLTLTGSTLRPRTVEQKASIAMALKERVWPLLNDGRIAPVIDSTFPLAAANDAHKRLESGAHIGKIVLIVK